MSEHILKTWGERYKIREDHLSEVCFLDLKPNQRCSWHTHAHKWNQFFVISGELTVKTDWGEVVLEHGEEFTVGPGDAHEFRTHDKPTQVLEIAWVRFDPEDIHRERLGGPIDG